MCLTFLNNPNLLGNVQNRLQMKNFRQYKTPIKQITKKMSSQMLKNYK
jgi:hypothetical protein